MTEGPIVFDSFEEYLAWQQRMEDQANSHLLDFQRELVPGDLVFRVVKMGSSPLLILGRTFTPDEMYDYMLERSYNAREAAGERTMVYELFSRGYLYGKWYSSIERGGEFGSAHVAVLGPKVPAEKWHRLLSQIKDGIDPLKEAGL